MDMAHVTDRSTQGDDRRRAQLLEAAANVFVKAPSGGLTLAAVAAEAKVSKRLMYYYFADVQSLYDELFRVRVDDHVHNVDAELRASPPTTPHDRIDTAVRVFLRLPAAYRRWALLAVSDNLPPELLPQSGPVLELLIARWRDLDTFSRLTPTHLATVMSMAVTNLCMVGSAMDAGDLTFEQATAIGVTAITGIAEVTERQTRPTP